MSFSLVRSPYQLVALSKLRSNGFSGLLVCDGVGVGKTISAGYIIYLHNQILNDPVVIVCHPILVPKWTMELREKFGIRTVPITSPEEVRSAWDQVEGATDHIGRRAYILPYSLLSRCDVDSPPSLGLVVYDEIHAVRNPETKSYSSALALASACAWRVGLTATPIHNSLEDLTSEFSVLFPALPRVSIGAVVNEAWQTGRTQLLHPWTTRFTKEKLSLHFTRREVRQETVRFPPLYVEDVEHLLSGTEGSHPRRTRPPSLETITRFRMAASSPSAFYFSLGRKVPSTFRDPKLELLRDIIGRSPEDRWLVFCEFVQTAKTIADSITDRPVQLLTGETPLESRPGLLEQFNSTPSSVMVLTHVGSEGLDLQSCSALVNYDLHWNPMVLEQRIGRIDRIGQIKKEVRVFNLIVEGSIDERVLHVLSRKLRLVANTFADPGRVLNSELRQRDGEQGARMVAPDERIVDEELREAERLLGSVSMTEAFPSEDYLLLPSLSPESCNMALWPTSPQQWIGPPPWIVRSEKARPWLDRISSSSTALRDLLTEYGAAH